MAAELVGGALLSSFLQVAFDKLASPDILNYFKERKINETLLKRLEVNLLIIDAVIDDAENKQIRNGKVKVWVDEVKDAAYEAEDLLDEIDIEVSKRKQQEADSQNNYTSKVWKFIKASVSSFDKEIESRMKQILDNLEYLVSQKDVRGLREGSGFGVGLGRISERSPTTSLVDEAEICGRNDEKESIIEWLLSDNRMGNCPYSVISVVAMGGIGKTTLAQLVYNDERMANEFDIKAWVCVSEEFDVVRVTRTILEAITLSADDTKNKNLLQLKLKEKLAGKRFFLVLDDVWNENYLNWEDLQKPFNEGAERSKIFVTSRHRKVAEIMRSSKITHLDQLPEGDSWLLFSKHAFHGRNPDSYPSLEKIGRKIVEKCQGLPLALKTIGSLLYSKESYEEWTSILTNEIWDMSEDESDVLPALRLSYFYLPSNLKRCFSYCSLFPKGYEFDRELLVWLWIGENLLHCSKSNRSMKEVGDQYFYQLLSRSFFQYSRRENEYFIMHDLVSDLAKYASGEFCFKLEVEEAVPQTISEKTGHFSFLCKRIFINETSKRFEAAFKANKLRTFLHVNMSDDTYYFDGKRQKMLEDVLSKFQSLKVLSFSNLNISLLPDSIGKLKHLRYLDLSYMRVFQLPDSICLLYNLQILKLRFCRCLAELPSDLYKLVNLRYLDIEHTQVRKMPMQLGKLKKLQVLTSFSVGKCCESDIKQLAELHLGGKLCISELQNVVNPMDASAINLKVKTQIDTLTLGWNIDNDESEKERDVLEKLQPHQNLKELSIKCYGGTRFSDWFGDNSLQNLVSLKLYNCKYCLFLPSLGLLQSLTTLNIIGFDSLVSIGPEFYGDSNSTILFCSLKTLVFENMKGWEDWECNNLSGAFPVLQFLNVRNCPRLKEQLPKQLPSLMSLRIEDCEQLVASIPHATAIQELTLVNFGLLKLEYIASTLEYLSIDGKHMEAPLLESIEHTIANSRLEHLWIDGCPNLEFPKHHCFEFLITISICSSSKSFRTFPLDFFPKLQRLFLPECSNLEMISVSEGLNHYITSITWLDIRYCPSFAFLFPKGRLSAPKLNMISIYGLEKLKSLPEKMDTLLPCLSDLTISGCPRLELFPEGGLPLNLKHLEISYCPTLIASRMKWGLHIHTSLVRMTITGDENMESLPDKGLLPHSLTQLSLDHFSNLRTLDHKGICHLSSLKELILVRCPRLECLPKEGLPNSLSSLKIYGCPLLSNRCQKPNGEDWGKIAHIQYILIDDCLIA